jgi:GT2 family glycosyltransferase
VIGVPETDNQTARRALAIVIVTYNSAAVLPGLLDSLPAGLEGVDDYEVVVADNASRDNSVALAEAHPIGARIVRTGRNGGYSAGINAGMAGLAADADVLVLNPDIRLRPGAVRLLVERLRDPAVGIAVPRILEEDGSVAPSLRREPSIVTAWSDALLGEALSRRLDIGEIVYTPAQYERDGSIEWATGAVVAIAARARQLVGDWDESYFMYSEEVDYQRQVRARGFAIDYVPHAQMVHIGGDYDQKPRLYAILTANRIRYFRRYHGPLATALFRLAVIVGEGLRSLRGSAVHRAGLQAALTRWTAPPESRTVPAEQGLRASDAASS